MDNTVVELRLDNGATALVRASNVDGGGATKSGATSSFDFSDVSRTIEGLCDAIKSAVTKAAPDKATVELGVELAIKSGKLTGLLVEGQGKGSFTITLEWGPGKPPGA